VTRPLAAVTFDFWNTLAYEEQEGGLHDRRAAAWGGILEEAEAAVERDALLAAFARVTERHQAAWRDNRQFLAAEAAEHAISDLGVELPADVLERLVAAFAGAGRDAELRLAPNVGGCLARLRATGVRLAIVCDVGFTSGADLRGFLERRGLLEHFDGWAFSDEVGVYKPDRRMFAHALAEIGGVEPRAAAHVGDLRRTDVAGSRAAGMLSVRYSGVFDDSGAESDVEADLVVADHADLPTRLGLEAARAAD
jgi:FMN phosphatase YigB (HAD superfamily)